MPARLRVTLVKSPIGHTARTRGTLRALGLRRIGQTVEIVDNEQMRGMTRTVRFLLHTEEAEVRGKAAGTSSEPAQAKADPAKANPAKADAAADAKPRRAARTKKETNE